MGRKKATPEAPATEAPAAAEQPAADQGKPSLRALVNQAKEQGAKTLPEVTQYVLGILPDAKPNTISVYFYQNGKPGKRKARKAAPAAARNTDAPTLPGDILEAGPKIQELFFIYGKDQVKRLVQLMTTDL